MDATCFIQFHQNVSESFSLDAGYLTDRLGVVLSTPSSYSGCPGFDSRLLRQLPWLGFFDFIQFPRVLGCTHELRPLFSISSYWTLYNLWSDKSSLNKLRNELRPIGLQNCSWQTCSACSVTKPRSTYSEMIKAGRATRSWLGADV
jgi:hypothetical protein